MVNGAWVCLLSPLAGFLAITLAGTRITRRQAGRISTASVFVGFAGAVVAFIDALSREPDDRAVTTTAWTWLTAGDFKVSLDLLIDPLSITMMLVVTGIGGLIVLYSNGYMLRILVTAFPEQAEVWSVAVAVLAVCSLAIGNFAAIAQRDVKRLLAYSSVSHAGFLLIAIAANSTAGTEALLYYLIPYSAASVGAFAVVAARERELHRPVTLDNLAGLGWERPFIGVCMRARRSSCRRASPSTQ